MFIVTPGIKLRCLLLRPASSYDVYCYARHQVTMFIVTPGIKLRCLLLRPASSYDVYCYARHQATMFIVTPGIKLRYLLLRPASSFNAVLLKAMCPNHYRWTILSIKTSIRSALWERVILKLCSNSITNLYMQQYCACTSNFKSHSRKRVSFYEFIDGPHTVF